MHDYTCGRGARSRAATSDRGPPPQADRPDLDRRLPRRPAVRLRHRRVQRRRRPDGSGARAVPPTAGHRHQLAHIRRRARCPRQAARSPTRSAGGRRSSLLAIMFFVGVLFVVFSPGFEILVAGRIILGLAVGGASTVVPVYLAELAPYEIRGSITGRNELAIVVGQFSRLRRQRDPRHHPRTHRWRVANHVRHLRTTRDRPVLRHAADARVAALARREGPL